MEAKGFDFAPILGCFVPRRSWTPAHFAPPGLFTRDFFHFFFLPGVGSRNYSGPGPGVTQGLAQAPPNPSATQPCLELLPSPPCRALQGKEELERVHEKGFCPGGHRASRAQNLSFFGYRNVLVPRFCLAPPNLLRGMSWGQLGAAGCWVPR